jgi:hypothetical protein
MGASGQMRLSHVLNFRARDPGMIPSSLRPIRWSGCQSGEPKAQFAPESAIAEGLWYQCLRSAGLFDLLAPLLSVLFSGMPPGRPGQLIPIARGAKVMPFHDPTPATAGRLEAPGPFCSISREKCGHGCDFFSAGTNNRGDSTRCDSSGRNIQGADDQTRTPGTVPDCG